MLQNIAGETHSAGDGQDMFLMFFKAFLGRFCLSSNVMQHSPTLPVKHISNASGERITVAVGK